MPFRFTTDGFPNLVDAAIARVTRRTNVKAQVRILGVKPAGDSGSVVFNKSKKMIGLHFAGSPSSSIFNRASHVMRLLEISVA